MKAGLAPAAPVAGCRSARVRSRRGPPEPILRATLDPPRVVVGQQVMLRIELLAPELHDRRSELAGFPAA